MDMTKHSFTALATALACVSLAACGDTTGSVIDDDPLFPDGATGDELSTVQDLVTYLEAEGRIVMVGESMTEPVFGVTGTQLTIDGQQVQIFQFVSEDAAEEAVADISPDGSTIGTSQVDWIGEPHFYQDDSLVALYVGTDEATLDALEDAFGAQVAGSDRDDDLLPGDDASSSSVTSATGAMMDDL